MQPAFDIVGFGKTRASDLAFPMMEGFGYCAPCNSPPPPPPPTSMPTFTPTCAPCTTTTGGLQATAQTANEAILVEAGEANKNFGLGQIPPGIRILSHAPHCKHWLLAYANGLPHIFIAGQGFYWVQTLNYLSQIAGTKTTFFTYTNNKHTYLFVYEVVGGQRVLKLCADGLRARRHPSGRFTMIPGKVRGIYRQRGLGNVISTQWSGYNSGYNGTNIYAKMLNFPVNSSWVRVKGSGSVSPEPNSATRLQQDLATILSSGYTNYDGSQGVNLSLLNQAGPPNFNGYIYFALSDSATGAAQTPGEPAGTVILRASNNPKTGALDIGMATTNATKGVPAIPVATLSPLGTPAAAATATSYTWLYVLLGVALVGGVGYYALA